MWQERAGGQSKAGETLLLACYSLACVLQAELIYFRACGLNCMAYAKYIIQVRTKLDSSPLKKPSSQGTESQRNPWFINIWMALHVS